jgi:hypothetical protein
VEGVSRKIVTRKWRGFELDASPGLIRVGEHAGSERAWRRGIFGNLSILRF